MHDYLRCYVCASANFSERYKCGLPDTTLPRQLHADAEVWIEPALGRATGITNSVTSNGVEDGSGKFHFLFVRDSDNDKDTSLLTALLKICSNNGVTHSTTRTPDKITGMWSINGVVGLNSIFYSDGTVIANYSAKGRWKRSSTNMYVAAFPLHPTIKLSYSAQRDQLTGDFVTEANTIGRDALYQRMPK